MSARERLRELIDQHQERLRATVPADRCSAVVAILRARGQASVDREPDLVAGRRLAGLGGNKALWLCLDPGSDATSAISMSDESLDDWAESFLVECDRLAEAEMVLAHCETGYMQLAEAGECSFGAWVTTRLIPASWRERDDIAWWASWLARHHIPARVAGNRDLAGNMLRAMEHQLGLPPEARIGGCTVATYRDVLRSMIERALSARDGGQQVVVRSGRVLILSLIHI